jgi:hypothetical protein
MVGEVRGMGKMMLEAEKLPHALVGESPRVRLQAIVDLIDTCAALQE